MDGRRRTSGWSRLSRPAGPGLVGRGRERRLIDDLLAAGADGGAALLLWGEPGVGKTALLEYAAEQAGEAALWARGIESETVLPFAALADLLLPFGAEFRELPGVQRAALESCLALSGEPLANPYAACMGALNVLAALGEKKPVAVLVDDLQWVDPSSQRVLLFVARRVAGERVALAFTSREEPGEPGAPHSLPSVEVTGLSRSECGQLLRRSGVVTAPAVEADLVKISGGNPLALLEAARSLTPEQARGEEPMHNPPSLGRHLERAWSARINALPEATRQALTVLAAHRSTELAGLCEALGVLGLSLSALCPAEEDGLVTAAGDGLDFRHPVLRPLVLGRAPLAHRLAAFGALAQVTRGPLHAWYRAAAATGPDAPAAAALAEAAEEARRRSAFEESALAWRRAAELTEDRVARADLLHRAASDAFLGGSASSSQWCEEALRTTTEPFVRADIELLLGRIHTWNGEPARAYELLAEAARTIRRTDAVRACVLLAEAVVPASMDGRVAAAVRTAEDSFRLASESGPDRWLSMALLGSALAVSGQIGRGVAMLGAADGHCTGDPVRNQQLYALAGQAWNWVEDRDRSRRLLNSAVESARRHSAPGVLPFTLAVRSDLEARVGHWNAGYGDATEALHWSEELGQISCVGYSLACLARLDALRGDRVRCEEQVGRARREVGGYGIGCLERHLTAALGLAALAQGDHCAAADQLEQSFALVTAQGVGNPLVVPCAADLVEAQLRTGDTARAGEVADWLEERARATGLAAAEAAAARCRGLLAASYEAARAAFAAALAAHERTREPFEQARTLLCEAELLRRYRHPAAARAPLASALARFESLGAVPWARRAAGELAATGAPPTAPAAPDGVWELLTPQEFQVARAVARGLNNTEAAVSLFVSRKTVEAHLTRVYRKLGVRSRTELTRLMASGELVD
ncbi:helix-turn-helix transcriptional regulator [Streptomyces paromomycinus]|uniref:Transcriptional regulator n=1 Tax=Streptomyces paromomycinus TaxID=92743 RepID=A0A401WF30_STREY|nr:LuxR family transcriptional regulator [Streptomyces paromomycinus]GCD47927.1 transcriptional regulator [Streptomyces paromomycinus]